MPNQELHYTEITDWPYKYFTPKEIACKGTGMIVVDHDALSKLDEFRERGDVPFSPNSAYRSESHNAAVGGAKNSYHRKGVAFDIPIKGAMTRNAIKTLAKQVGFTGIGDYNTFVHIDTGTPRYWDKRS